VYCARHPSTDALWECTRCEALHCDACVRRVGEERRSIAACAHCDGVLRRLAVRVVAPAAVELPGLLGRVRSPTALVTAGVVGFCGGAATIPVPVVDLLFAGAGLVVMAGTWFNVIDHLGRGKPGFPAPAETDGWPPATLALRGMLLLLLAFVPFGIWLGTVRGAESVGQLVAARPGVAALLGVGSLTWLTAAVLAMLVTVRGLAAYWPPVLVRVVALDPQRYLGLLGVMVGTTVGVLMVRWVVARAFGGVPFVSAFLVGTATALAVFVQAALVGGFVHRHRELYTTR
jgi:hypothetical protein